MSIVPVTGSSEQVTQWLALLPATPAIDEFGRPWQLAQMRGMTPGQRAYYAVLHSSREQAPAQDNREQSATGAQLAQADTCGMLARNGVATDTHLYSMQDGKLRKINLPRIAHVGDLLQLCLTQGLDAIWIVAGSELSDKATRDFIDAQGAREQWQINNPQFSHPEEYDDGRERCTYLLAWKRKEARTEQERGRMVGIGYAEHNHRWGFDQTSNPVQLLGALTYVEDALKYPARFTPYTVGKNLMPEHNKNDRRDWVRPVDLSTFPAILKTKVIDIRWKRALSSREQATGGYLLGADKNSMYPASCTSALLGSGMPAHVDRTRFDVKKPLAGVYRCTVQGSSEFDGVTLPHPLQNLRYTQADGVLSGWFWTYTVKLLCELGYSVDIEEAYVWQEAHTILRPWAESLWAARAALDDRNPACDRIRYRSQEARALAYGAIKTVLNASLGLLDSVPKHPERPGAFDWYRPDWYALIKDNARYQMFWRMRSQLARGHAPIGMLADCLCYLTDSDEHISALPGMFDRADKLGGYKRKYTRPLTVNQVAPLFNNPRLDMGEINTTLVRYDHGQIEL